ncbi:MAG: ATP-binding protein, partial [bacterium]
LRVSATPGPTPNRYATLGDAIDWSYRLLSDEERTLFNRLAMFAGSFAPEATHEICGDGGASTRTLDLLSGLVERSMVVLVETPKGEIRYRLLETLRQFALARLRETGEEEATARRRRDFFLRLAEQATMPELRGPRQAYWLDRLELELDNFRETLAWCRSAPDGAEPMLRLVVTPQIFWMVRGHYHEARRWIEAALALNGDSPSTLRADALLAVAGIAQVQGDIAASRENREEALRISRALGDRRFIGATLRELGWWYQDQGDYTMARSLHEESLDTHRRIGHRAKTFLALRALGWIELDQGNYAEARVLLDESVTVCREIGHVAGVAGALRPLGWIAQDQGDYGTARALHESSLATFRELGTPGGIASSLRSLGRVAQRTGDQDTARARYEESLEIFRRSRNPWGIGWCLHGLGSVAGLMGDYAAAVTSLEESLLIFRGLSFTQGIGLTLCALGRVARQQGHGDRAAALYTEALSLLRRIPDRAGIAECLEGYAGAAAAQKQFTRAARVLGAAAALRDAIGAPVPTCDRPDYDRVDAAVRSGLTQGGFTAEWNRGRKMSLDQAIQFTSAVVDPGVPQ